MLGEDAVNMKCKNHRINDIKGSDANLVLLLNILLSVHVDLLKFHQHEDHICILLTCI